MNTATAIGELLPHFVGVRHRLHQIPELAYEEFDTAAVVREELARLGVDLLPGIADAPTATVAMVGDPRKPCIALRADIDALPIHEQTGLPYASQRVGLMHACGHDGHTATLLATAAVLKRIEGELPVCVKLIWQPAEEGGGGAWRLVDNGVLDGRIGPRVSAIFGLHGWPGLKVGQVSTRPGPLLASTDSFAATFVGKGCHGAYPHLGVDPILTAAEATISLQCVASRETDPTDSIVVTVGKFNAGTATNIIPDTATIEATVRTLRPETRSAARMAIERRLRGIADAHGCDLRFEWVEGYPSTVNDPELADYVMGVARHALGVAHALPADRPSMGGEDFAYYLQQVPGCFFLIGLEALDRTGHASLHSDQFDFTDAAMGTGVRVFVELVRGYRG